MIADTPGHPLRFAVTAGQVGNVAQAQVLLAGHKKAVIIADQAFDSNALRALIAQMGAEAVIPCNRTREIVIVHDTRAYKLRNRIERCFNRFKHFRRFATRYDRRTIHLASAMIWMA